MSGAGRETCGGYVGASAEVSSKSSDNPLSETVRVEALGSFSPQGEKRPAVDDGQAASSAQTPECAESGCRAAGIVQMAKGKSRYCFAHKPIGRMK